MGKGQEDPASAAMRSASRLPRGWAATTTLIRAKRLARVSATKTSFYHPAVSAALLPFVSLATGEAGVVAGTPVAIASLAYQ